MNILVLNSGSSSLKFQLIDTYKKEVLIKGKFEKIGYHNSIYSIKNKLNNLDIKDENKEFFTHKSALEFLFSLIDLSLVDAIGHRVVHGGEKFKKATLMTKELVDELEKLNDLAPLHNKANVKGIKLCMELMPDKKNVAVFDTSFHSTIEEAKYIYPIPYKFYEEYGIRKYGFHGTSVKYVSYIVDELLEKEDSKIIVCHLGNGASITAVRNKKSVDTSMGFTPLSGIPMGTRCGSIDPSIVRFLFEKGYGTRELFKILNEESGMKGICGISDNREMTEAMENGDKLAELAFNVYSNRVSTFIGSYFVELEGVDAIVFTGGIGENSVETRRRICSKLKALNIILDDEKNNTIRENGIISSPESSVKLFMIKTDEEMMIAKDTEEILK